MNEWNFEKNSQNNIFPEQITSGSNIKVDWKCSICGYEWQTAVKNRTRKDGKATGCPMCKRKRLSKYHETPIKGFNDLKTMFPEIAKEWNREKNGNLLPEDVLSGSGKKVWWKCSKCGYEWQTAVHLRTGKNQTGCPICSAKKTGMDNAKTIKGVNDLKTLYPKLVKEWDYEKNKDLPENYLPGSNKKVWWKCSICGYEWKSSIVNRTRGRNCSRCLKEYHISYPEKAVYYYIKKYFKNALENVRLEILEGKELDIYIPNLKIGIEYDGYSWHQDANKDFIKDELCQKNQITLIRLREPGLPTINSSTVIYNMKRLNDKEVNIEDAIIWLLNYLKCSNIDINIKRDNEKILKLMDLGNKKNSILKVAPDIVKDWNYEKNKGLNPAYFTKGSEKVVWWKCSECGYEWQNKIKDRIKRKGCPICSKNKLKIGINDYKTLYPKLADDWDYEKNKIKLEEIPKSKRNEKFWWKCKNCGYEWQLSIRSKIVSTYCPKCATKVGVNTRHNNYIKKYGSLSTNYPEIAKEWNYKKNGNLLPNNITSKNKKVVWWKCKDCSYEWQASIALRTNGFGRCPNCKK